MRGLKSFIVELLPLNDYLAKTTETALRTSHTTSNVNRDHVNYRGQIE